MTENINAYREKIWNSVRIPVSVGDDIKELPYNPTQDQLDVHNSQARIKLITGGEGSGKSLVTAMEGFLAVPRVKLIWIAGNEYNDTDMEFEYMLDWMQQTGLLATHRGSRTNPPQYARSITGCEIVSKAVKDPVKIGSESPDLILGCEAARFDYLAYLRLRGRIARNRGSLIMSGTLEDSLSWYPEFATRWSGANPEGAKSFSIPTWSNVFKYPHEGVTVVLGDGTVIEDTCEEIQKLAAETPIDIFKERYMGVVCKPSNLVIPDFTNSVHVSEDIKFNKELNVEIAVDPGYGGAYAVLAIQKYKDQIWVIDEVYLQGYINEQVVEVCMQKPWWKNVVGGTIDIAGRQHQADRAPIEVWSEKAKIFLRSRKVNEEQGIDFLRTKLHVNPLVGHPTIVFSPYCSGIIAEMGGGKAPIKDYENVSGQLIKSGPWMRDKNLGRPIDKNNHSCKALIYYIVDMFGYVERKSETTWGKVFSRADRRELARR